jgi:4-hydroxythreonine-4-phosphate dehydrogenase
MTGRQLPLLITMGDPAGIGLEITLNTYAKRHEYALKPLAILGCIESLRTRLRAIGADFPLIPSHINSCFDDFSRGLPVIPLQNSVHSLLPDARNAPAIIESIKNGVVYCHKGLAHGLITNPIAKYVLAEAGFKHPGHTEYLGELTQTLWGKAHKPVMLLWSEILAVVPITVHIALKDVPKSLTTAKIIETVHITARDYSNRFNIPNPRLAFCGLNPHASDNGLMGNEEAQIIMPALEALKNEGLHITGLFAADTLFHARARKNYDIAFGMYHDQVLTPMKTLAFDEGVNVTLGLPFIRTSPDHGTAFDIAGKGIARETSLVEAIRLAGRLKP